MRNRITGLSLVAIMALGGAAFAAKSYQVTGPVVEVTDQTITVEKGKEAWEIGRDAATKVTGGEIKAGDKVTIHYVMTAKDIEVKEAKAAAKPAETKAPEAKPKATATPAKK